MPNGLFYFNSLDGSVSNTRGVSLLFLFILPLFIEIPVLINANSVDPDQTARSVASDLGLHCLQMTLL